MKLLTLPMAACALALPTSAQCLAEHYPFLGFANDTVGEGVDSSGNLLAMTGSDEVMGGGLLRIFTWSGSSWDLFFTSFGQFGKSFGHDVCVSDEFIAIAQPCVGQAGAPSAGSVQIYRNSGGWGAGVVVRASDAEEDDEFGHALDMDNDHLVVGAWKEGTLGQDAGAIYVFRNNGNGTFTELQKLTASDGAAGDLFGSAIALDGTTVLVGAPGAEATYVFELVGASFVEVQRLDNPSPAQDSSFGIALAIDGDHLGASVLGPAGGAVHLFERAGPSWQHVQRLTPTSGLENGGFGTEISIQGTRLAVGVPKAKVDGHVRAGKVALYREDGGAWSLVDVLTDPSPAALERFGESVSLGKDGLMVGVPGSMGTPSPNIGSAVWLELAGTEDVLEACVGSLSVAAGGEQDLRVAAGSVHAGDFDLLLGSLSDSTPGVFVGGLHLPLNPDAYFAYTLANVNQPPLSGAFGNLDDEGRGEASFAIAPGVTPPAFVGHTFTHAALVLDASTGWLELVSNHEDVDLLP